MYGYNINITLKNLIMSKSFKKRNTIISEYDKNYEIARVILNENCVMEGNYWDFHPGFHGIHEWGDFKSPVDLVAAIKRKLEEKGETVEVITREYKYE